MKRIYEIVTNGPPQPYISRDEGEKEILLTPTYEDIDKLVTKIGKLIDFNRNSGYASDA